MTQLSHEETSHYFIILYIWVVTFSDTVLQVHHRPQSNTARFWYPTVPLNQHITTENVTLTFLKRLALPQSRTLFKEREAAGETVSPGTWNKMIWTGTLVGQQRAAELHCSVESARFKQHRHVMLYISTWVLNRIFSASCSDNIQLSPTTTSPTS